MKLPIDNDIFQILIAVAILGTPLALIEYGRQQFRDCFVAALDDRGISLQGDQLIRREVDIDQLPPKIREVYKRFPTDVLVNYHLDQCLKRPT